MKYVTCINNSESTMDLTIGKKYELLGVTKLLGKEAYAVKNDYGLIQPYFPNRFEIVKEEQGEKVLSYLEKEYGIKDVNYKIMYVPLEQMRKDCGIKNICNSASKGKLRYATVEGKIKHFSPPQIIIEDNEFGMCILNMDQVINMIPNMEENKC